ncbi:outer membrane porin, OprD family [Pseudomonas syringae pv. actinidiae]|nr:outer membrane porin, OprD family [Pseudomonas syringae pv. actinidiae]
MADFVRDSKATLNIKNAYENIDFRSGAAAPSKTEEWGQAYILDFQSGYTDGVVGFGVDALGLWGIRLDSGGTTSKANRTRNPGTMFPLESDNSAVDQYGSIGLTAKAKVSKTVLKVGTLQPQLPVIRTNNGRLLPQSYQGGQITSQDISGLTFTAGKINEVKSRVSTNWEGMRINGGTQLSNEFYYGGGDYAVTKGLTLSYYYGNLKDYYKQNFFGLLHSYKFGEGVFKTDLRYFNSDSDGENGSNARFASAGYYSGSTTPTRGKVDNNLWSGFFSYTIYGHTLGFGYQRSNGESDFPSLNQGDGSDAYIYTDAMLGRFGRSGERTWFGRYSYDFAALGVSGLIAGMNYYSGDHVRTSSGDKSEWERDLSLGYVVQSGSLKGLSLTWRTAVFRTAVVPSSSFRDQDENRIIINYPLSIL